MQAPCECPFGVRYWSGGLCFWRQGGCGQTAFAAQLAGPCQPSSCFTGLALCGEAGGGTLISPAGNCMRFTTRQWGLVGGWMPPGFVTMLHQLALKTLVPKQEPG